MADDKNVNLSTKDYPKMKSDGLTRVIANEQDHAYQSALDIVSRLVDSDKDKMVKPPKSITGGYPVGKSRKTAIRGPIDLEPSDHFRTDKNDKPIGIQGGYIGGENIRTLKQEDWMRWTGDRASVYKDDQSYLVPYKGIHFIRDMNDTQHQDPKAANRPTAYPDGRGGMAPVFSGSTTFVNAENDQAKAEIMRETLSETERKRIQELQGDINSQPPLSPLHPFTRLGSIQNRHDARIANLTTFNRFHMPIADLEHRKAFRHVFFTRPECYIMYSDGIHIGLSQQAEYDEDFNTSFARFPHISALLSPVYVTGGFSSKTLQDNFNYLLSNRCTGLTVTGGTLATQDSVTKSIGGYTVTPGMNYEGRQGSTISVTFRDTKDLEVYEYIRMWMLYIWKRKLGTFAPSFNGYRYINGFPACGKDGINLLSIPAHPYDRALDYTCSMFDFIMDETGEYAKYWCKYYGLYPIDIQCEGLNNTNNDALKTEMNVTVSFKYQYKLENVMRSLIEFNFNAGICDKLGTPKISLAALTKSQSYFNRENKEDSILPYYDGAAGMFVGTPYVIMVSQDKDYLKISNGKTAVPSLQFLPVSNEALDKRINLGLTSTAKNSNILARSELSQLQQSALDRKQNTAKQEQLDEQQYNTVLANKIANIDLSTDAIERNRNKLIGSVTGDSELTIGNIKLSTSTEDGLKIDLSGVNEQRKQDVEIIGEGLDAAKDKYYEGLDYAAATDVSVTTDGVNIVNHYGEETKDTTIEIQK